MMVILRALVLSLSFSAFTIAQSGNALIPLPQSIKAETGSFSFSHKTKIIATDAAGIRLAEKLNDRLQKIFGFKLELTSKPQKKNAIVFITALPTTGVIPNPESYSLQIEPGFIRIAGSERGMFLGMQTLLQLLPMELNKQAVIQAVSISDKPRFGYRGMHLDVGRHFMPVDFVKKYIDLMSQYKFNTFHWHLTEDQGWRIEIKKYPRLTEIGSKRKETVKERNLTPYIGDGIPVEGFYTQDEIRDVVAYAKDRYITVIPEIELPGHSSAALAAYPELGCKENYDYKVQTTWGIFKEVYCPTEKTFQFLEDVLTETIALFPDSPYIHIGGDEVLKDHWKESPFVQELKLKLGLKDEHEVQSYFIQRMEKFINSKGKKIIGWDEILEGGLAPNATVMSWRGNKGGIEAAKAKHDVIMTPTDYVYFDYGQGDPAYEPINIGSYVTTERVYNFDPLPKELSADEARYILGGQGNIWTEYIKTPDKIEYMAFPRMLALAEALWLPPEKKDYAGFSLRLANHLARLDRQNVNYRIPAPIGLRNIVLGSGDQKARIELTSALANAKIFYTTDGSNPDDRSTLYTGPFEVALEPGATAEVKTVVIAPTGRKSSVYAATIMRREMAEPVQLSEKKEGVKYLVEVPSGDVSVANQVIEGETKSTQIQQFEQKIDLKKPFGVSFDGYLNVSSDGIYEFQVSNIWDTTILVSGEKIIDSVGTKDRQTRSALIPLKAGLHKISIRYNHRGGQPAFSVRWGIKGEGLRGIGGGELFH